MSDMFDNIEMRAKAKLGPLPVYGWVGVLAGVALVYYKFVYSKKKAATAVSSATTTTATNPYVTANGSSGVTVVDGNTIPANVNVAVADTSKATANYVRDGITGGIYSVVNGVITQHLSMPQYQALGSPATTPITPQLIRDPASGEIDQEFNGTRYHLSGPELQGILSADPSLTATPTPSTDPVWQEPLSTFEL